MTTETKLPEHLGDLINLAVDDLEKCEKSKDYLIHMGIWHSQKESGECQVCLAGAVLAQSCGYEPDEHLEPEDGPYSDMALALDNARKGDLCAALFSFYPEAPNEWAPEMHAKYHNVDPYTAFPTYEKDPEIFKAAMRGMATFLLAEIE